VVRLGEHAAAGGGTDPRATLEPFVTTLLELRDRARAAKDWPAADLIRTRLTEAGVEVRDSADGSTWVLADR
jgi:cysteinyl-tRNA synthetase